VDIDIKKCNRCKVEYPKSAKYFCRDKSKRDGYRTLCKKCVKEYKELNKEKVDLYQKEYHKKYYKDNRQVILSRMTEYYESNQDKVLSYHKEYYEKNKEELKEKQRKYIIDNRESVLEGKKVYHRNNLDKAHAARLRRKARVRLSPHDFTSSDRNRILKDFNDSCCLSGESEDIHMDHVLPLCKGGGTVVGNIVPLSGKLNLSKNDRNLFVWFEDNKGRLNLSRLKFNELIKYLAEQNELTVEEYAVLYNKKYAEGIEGDKNVHRCSERTKKNETVGLLDR